jgi:long-chain acyl-CoA synthetase
MADMATQQIGVIWVPVYPTTNPLELTFILNDASVQYMFASNQELYNKVMSIKDKVPCLKEVYTFDHIAGAKHWSELCLKDADLLQQVDVIKKTIPVEQVATFIYTSGTTGTPKGVMLTHHNIYFNLQAGKKSFPFPDSPNQKVLSFLPLCHIFERTASFCFVYMGYSIYYAENMETIGDNIREVKPDVFTAVPRLLEKVYDRIMDKGKDLTGAKRKLFFWAVELAEEFDLYGKSAWYNLRLGIAPLRRGVSLSRPAWKVTKSGRRSIKIPLACPPDATPKHEDKAMPRTATLTMRLLWNQPRCWSVPSI